MEFPFDRPLKEGGEEREGEKLKLAVSSYQGSEKTTEMTDPMWLALSSSGKILFN